MQRLGIARAGPYCGGVIHDDVIPAGLQPLVTIALIVQTDGHGQIHDHVQAERTEALSVRAQQRQILRLFGVIGSKQLVIDVVANRVQAQPLQHVEVCVGQYPRILLGRAHQGVAIGRRQRLRGTRDPLTPGLIREAHSRQAHRAAIGADECVAFGVYPGQARRGEEGDEALWIRS